MPKIFKQNKFALFGANVLIILIWITLSTFFINLLQSENAPFYIYKISFLIKGSFAFFSLFSILFFIFSPPIAFGLLFGEGLKFSIFFIWIWILNLKFF